MTFGDWLEKLPEIDRVEIEANPKLSFLLQKAYTAGHIERGIREQDRRVRELADKRHQEAAVKMVGM